MGGANEGRLHELVERPHPFRIERHADDWARCAAVLKNASADVRRGISSVDVGGQTGPALRAAFLDLAAVLEEGALDLRRGSRALAELAEETKSAKNRKRDIDGRLPDDGAHVVERDHAAASTSDSQEAALRHGIAVMKSIRADEPRGSVPIQAPTTPPPPPPTMRCPRCGSDPCQCRTVDGCPRCGASPCVCVDGPHVVTPVTPVHPHCPDWDDPADFTTPGTAQGPSSLAPGAPQGSLASGVSPGVVGGAAGAVGAAAPAAPGAVGAMAPMAPMAGSAAGAAPVAGTPGSAGAVRPIGAGGPTGSAGTLGRSGGAGAGAGAAGAGGRGRGGKDRKPGARDRDLHDDGRDWLDDESAPDVLR
ncbi:hypothetical protein FE634_01350 [Nocardioides dongxiaopingii]|uniref:hypothetical protein n=1 Tax=Nocardioides sp. S-1144 TaxID=2582905 RepID=UPI00110E9A85|nr:hypothetical protein [Nocardioides sp. S-1144]QCW49399.1 hypothetical protein FE634_01350 [Nocardioides sp. S-1144]